jgi:hypothetical protein
VSAYDDLGALLSYREELKGHLETLDRNHEIIDGLIDSGVAYNRDLLAEERLLISRESRRLDEVYDGVDSRVRELERERP